MSKKSETKAQKKQQMEAKSKKSNQMRTLMMATGGVFLLLLIIVGFVAFSGNDQGDSLNVPYAGQPVQGDANAPITITEFGDFKCPACKTFTEEYFPYIKRDYIDKGIAKFTFLNNPILGPDSYTAAAAGEAIYHQNEQAFWPFLEAVYKHQGDERQQWATPEFLVNLVKQEKLEINYDQLAKDLEAGTFDKKVREDEAFAVNSGITSTPTLLINGKLVQNPFDYNEIKQLIAEELKGTQGNEQK
ncbi:MAG TPA: thioredoxin domain-containing protein [Candidatus Bathyarchaeia archaeon]|nr:thioredoxin domain-containing protein [Candidatus Bathyarchaeia archaeon]